MAKKMLKPAKRKSGTTPLTSSQKTWLKKETAKRKSGGNLSYKKPTAAEARKATSRKKK